MVFLKAKQSQKKEGFQFNCIEFIHAGHNKKMIKSYFPNYFFWQKWKLKKQFTTYEEYQLKNIFQIKSLL